MKNKLLLVLICIFSYSCINSEKKVTPDVESPRNKFVKEFESLLSERYKDNSKDLLLQLIEESNEIYTQVVCIDGIDQLINSSLGDSIWKKTIYNGDTIYSPNFKDWYCPFLESIMREEIWIQKYYAHVCTIGDISPSAVVIILDQVTNSSLKDDNVRLLIAVHFITFMKRKPTLPFTLSDTTQ